MPDPVKLSDLSATEFFELSDEERATLTTDEEQAAFVTRVEQVRAEVARLYDVDMARLPGDQEPAFVAFVRGNPDADVTSVAAAFGQAAGLTPSLEGDPAAGVTRAFADPDVGEAEDPLIAELQARLQQVGGAGDFQTLQQFQDFGLGGGDAEEALRRQFGLPSAGDVARADRGLDIAGMNATTSRINAQVNQELATAEILLNQQQFEAAEVHLDRADALNKFSAAFIPLEFNLAERQTALQEGGVITNAFRALTDELSVRGQLEGVAGTGFTNLTQVIGNLAAEQQRLGLDILRTPRNAIPAFLMGLGQDPEFSQFDVKNILGIDPSQIQNIINQAVGAFQGVRDVAGQPFTSGGEPFDLLQTITDLQQSAVAAGDTLPQLSQFTGGAPDVEAEQMADGILPPQPAPVTATGTPAPGVTINLGTPPSDVDPRADALMDTFSPLAGLTNEALFSDPNAVANEEQFLREFRDADALSALAQLFPELG